ncbi:Lipoate-protein ligase A [hydrothermal vent metagenome]|uniref:lipoate--protein ligase n=1 Tax=hydrothermal vent metagenome TaxID=652676 RepID=A0A3B0UF55_9ZZZZ
MFCINLKDTSPFFCLAAEEFLLKNFEEDIFMLWQSHDTVVVGKHQNALAEINYPFVRRNNITVARRISGGGTVFHDKGNVNFAFIKSVRSTQEISFRKFTEPIVKALASIGITAESSGRNDLLVEGKKVSGNAEHIFKKRVLHHGTLLFNSDLKNLGEAIRAGEGKYISKAIRSNRSDVVNISDFTEADLDIRGFIRHLFEFQLNEGNNIHYSFGNKEKAVIEELAARKFSAWEWCFGYSPKYLFRNIFREAGKELQIEIQVEKGIIRDCKLEGGLFSDIIKNKIAGELTGRQHRFEEISNILELAVKNPSEEMVYAFF